MKELQVSLLIADIGGADSKTFTRDFIVASEVLCSKWSDAVPTGGNIKS